MRLRENADPFCTPLHSQGVVMELSDKTCQRAHSLLLCLPSREHNPLSEARVGQKNTPEVDHILGEMVRISEAVAKAMSSPS